VVSLLREVVDGDLDVFFAHQQEPEAFRMVAFTAKDPLDRDASTSAGGGCAPAGTLTVRAVLVDGCRPAGHVASWIDPQLGEPE